MHFGSSRRAAAGLVIALSVGLSGSAFAADVNARIKGTVTDAQDAVLPGITVVATNQATGLKFTTKTNGDGSYLFPELPIGTYTLSVAAPGFKGFKASGITLNIDQEYVEPVKLGVGETTETLEVAADAVQVNTTDMQLNNIVDAKQIVEYPLVGRSFTQLELILPGVQQPSDRFGGNYSVNGSESQQSSYLINGADTNDFALNTIGIQPNLDALDQFNLITGPQNAEYSRNSGAIVSTVVKAGTNAFHGDVFEYYRDTFLDTRDFFHSTVSPFHQNFFGGTLGGPIIKDKFFFFGAYQGDRVRQPQSSNNAGNSVVPTVAQRSGNFAGTAFTTHLIPGTIVIPGCTSNTGGNNPAADTFASCFGKLNGVLPTTAFNPISAALLSKYVPLPNSGTNHYTFNTTTTSIQDQGILRTDFNPTQRDQIYFVGIYQHAPSSDVTPFTGPSLPGFGDVNTSEIRQFSAFYTRQLSSTAINDFEVHYTRFNFGSVTPQQIVQPSSAGFAINPQLSSAASLPLISLAGNFAIGFSTNGPQPRVDQNYQLDDNFSKSLGKHQLKFGFDGRRFNVDNEFSGSNNGSYSFSQSSGTNPNTSGNVVLDFLLGNTSGYTQGAGGRISAVSYEDYVYAQDTWKATSNLTLNYGLGYQIDTAIHNKQFGGEGVNCFVPGQQSKVFPTAPLSLNFPGDPGCNDAQGATTPFKDFGPRIGFAYSPEAGFLTGGNSHKLSIRAGYGIYYNRTEEEGSLQNLNQVPFGVSSSGIRDAQNGPNDRAAFGNPYQNDNTGATITNPFPASFPKPGATNVTFPTHPLYISQYAPNYRVPYSENFQLSVEREFPGQNVMTLSYVGALARHNQNTIEGNPVTRAGHDACLADPTCIANANDQEILYPSHTLHPQPLAASGGTATYFYSDANISTEGTANYNALEASVKKGSTHGLSYQISYTYGHSLDTASSFEGAGFGGERGYNQYDTYSSYGNSDFDARHRLVIAPIYTVPSRGGDQLSPLNLLLSGWEVSGIVTFATGHPYDIAYDGTESYSLYCSANDFYYTCPDVPNQIAPLKKFNPHNAFAATKGELFDPTTEPNDGTVVPGATFQDELLGTFGNIGRNRYYGPGLNYTNLVIAKNFKYSKENPAHSIQIRLESYNVFNHTNFGLPNGNPDNGPGTFGVITQVQTSVPSRQTQLVGKIYF